MMLVISFERKTTQKEKLYSGSVIFTTISADELFKGRHKYKLTRTN